MDDQNEACRRLLLDELDFLKAMYMVEELEVNEPQDPAENGQVTQLTLHQVRYFLKIKNEINFSFFFFFTKTQFIFMVKSKFDAIYILAV